jgi:hypothetical protein
VREPIYLSCTVANRSSEDLEVVVGNDTWNMLGRPERFTMQVVRDDGVGCRSASFLRVSPLAIGNRLSGPQRIPAGGSYTFSLFLPDWVEFKEPGRYTITAARTLDVRPYNQNDMSWRDPATLVHVDVQASAKVTVAPFNRAAFGEVILDRSRVMLSADAASEGVARAAATALAAMDDDRVIEPFSRAVAESGYSVKFIAVGALAKFNSDAALEALKQAARDRDDNIRLAAAFALLKSPHPSAIDALLTLRADPFWSVRHVVLEGLAKTKSAESLELIRAMTSDPDARVRTEAQGYLKLRTEASTPTLTSPASLQSAQSPNAPDAIAWYDALGLAGEGVSVMQRTITGGRATLQTTGTATTDDRGAYRVAGLAPGKYALVFNGQQHVLSLAADDGRTAAVMSMVFPMVTFPPQTTDGEPAIVMLSAGEELRNIDFQVAPVPAARVSGIVMGTDGSTAGVQLELAPASSAPILGVSRWGYTGPDGRFSFDPMPAGRYVIRVRKEPSLPGSAEGQGPPQGVTIQTGQTTMTFGAPQTQQPPARPPRRVSTEPTLWADVPIVVGASDVTDVVVSLRSSVIISGHVEFDGTTAPPTAALLRDSLDVRLSPADTRQTYVAQARVDVSADGRFTIFGVTPNRYVLRGSLSGPSGGWTLKAATVADLDASIVPLTVSTTGIDGLTLVFTDRRSRITGSVTDAAGRPAAGAAVLCFPTDRLLQIEYGGLAGLRVRRLNTGIPGAMFSSDLPPGEYFLVATLDDPGSDWQDPDTLDALARVATRATIGEGETRRQDLRVQHIK